MSNRHHFATLTCTLGCVLSLAGCPGPTPEPPDSGSSDAGPQQDGAIDAATSDSGADAAIAADVGAAMFTLTVEAEGAGSGTVTSVPAGIDCGADCTEEFAAGTTITLAASPASGSTFAGWSGGGCAGAGVCVVTISDAVTVTASFALEQYVLSVLTTGTGMGSVTSAPSGIDCGADCSESFDAGTTVTLTAAPEVGSVFAGWSGGGCSGTATCVTTITAVTAVAATFTLSTHELDVVLAGTGVGTVSSSPAGIDCGVDCTEAYGFGTMVTLTASPGVGSTFAGWSGGGCTGTGACTTTITAAASVTATFVLTTHTLSVARAGAGAGGVTSSPPGIDCGVDCAEDYAFGTTVVLSATPGIGSTFGGWSGGGCSGTGTCTTTVTAATSVTATFTPSVHPLTVARAGTGTGTVTSSPAGINCGADCTESYVFGTVVVLTAAPTAGSTFVGWSGGGCTGTGTCTTTITTATSVTATFAVAVCPSGSMTFSYTGAVQFFTVPACVTSITVDARGASGGDGWNVDVNTALGLGGNGGRVQATLVVTGGELLSLYVGGAGANATTMRGVGGFNGGGDGGNSPFGYSGGGGGGATDIRRGSALASRILVAGGGGAGSGWCTSGAGNGGVGGGLTGGSGSMCVGAVGTGGTQTAGGTANGALGVGGTIAAGTQAASGGGGGWYGGGAHDGSGGGGGSSYVTPSGSSAITHTQGFQDGNGAITISW